MDRPGGNIGIMRIAILEDDTGQADAIRHLLESAGHSVHVFLRGRALLGKLGHESFDLLIIDWEIPDVSGMEVMQRARAQLAPRTPILFLTHRDSEHDIVQALEAGADDFLVKPPREHEFLARVHALGRRGGAMVSRDIVLGPYRVDLARSVIERDSNPVNLTRREYELALFLFRNPGKVVSRAHILESVWGRSSEVTTRTIDTHVSRLRNVLGLSSANGVRLTPIYGYGYRLEAVAPASG